MGVNEALALMISFATLGVSILAFHNKKQTRPGTDESISYVWLQANIHLAGEDLLYEESAATGSFCNTQKYPIPVFAD